MNLERTYELNRLMILKMRVNPHFQVRIGIGKWLADLFMWIAGYPHTRYGLFQIRASLMIHKDKQYSFYG